ncbi:MAG: alpha-E domain-containing protein, partial [Loktanella sp.]|nr:alpha-E domain-containing protein [Loktanella sp.]
ALLPSPSFVGSRMDNVQWETILRSVSAHRSFRWAVEDDFTAPAIADFLILDDRMPRSLSHCAGQLLENLRYLARDYGEEKPSLQQAARMNARLKDRDIGSIFDEGLHEFVGSILEENAAIGMQIETDYRFNS